MEQTRSVPETTASSWTTLLEELYRESWDSALRRHRSQMVYRGMPDAATDLRPSLLRLAGEREVAKLEGHFGTFENTRMQIPQRAILFGTGWL
jgi:hypothetical protein